MAESSIERQYKKMLEDRAKNIAKNVTEGRTLEMKGTSLLKSPETASTLSEVLNTLKTKGGTVQNIADEVKTTPGDLIGIKPEVAYKSRFANLDKKIGNIGSAINEEAGGLLHNQKGYSKILPMLGMGAAGLAALGIANKVQAGEYAPAAADTADLATDFVPVLGEAKMALRPSELGNAELPPEVMQERDLYNAARQGKFGEKVNNPSLEQPQLAPEDRANYEDMKNQFSGIMSRIKK